jgi:predicted lipoprotein with Yx(FWY)xxD motif
MIGRRVVVIGGFAAIVALAACSSGSSNKSSSKNTTTTKPATSATSAAAPATAAAVKDGNTSLGKVLVDSQGKTLYLFKNDKGTTSEVPAGLLALWPPITASSGATVGPGLDQSKLVAVKQSNGQTWLTYNGHVLYTYKPDTSPGDTKGQKLANVWFVVSSTGTPIGE